MHILAIKSVPEREASFRTALSAGPERYHRPHDGNIDMVSTGVCFLLIRDFCLHTGISPAKIKLIVRILVKYNNYILKISIYNAGKYMTLFYIISKISLIITGRVDAMP